jgi:integrase
MPLLAQGIPLRTIMELLGHSTIALTANTYGHLSDEMVADAAATMDGTLFSSSTPEAKTEVGGGQARGSS